MASQGPVHTGTLGWQAEYVNQHLAHQVAYLETVAASPLLRQAAANALSLLSLAPGQSVLEVGCGSGVILPALAECVSPDGRVVGVDHADGFVREARALVSRCGLQKTVTVDEGDAYKLPYSAGTFDAAHCERVLMHLEDPDAAIREMIRVVRPGGIVVAVEPDWTGIRIDHQDQEAFERVYARTLSMRNKNMGLTLYRRFGELGLQERRYLPATAVITDFAQFRMFGLKLERGVEALLNDGTFSPDRLNEVVPQLERTSTLGTFYSIGTVHVVAGIVPK